MARAIDSSPDLRRSYDFNNGIDFEGIMNHFKTTGFQGTNLAAAIDEVNKMVRPAPRGDTRLREQASEARVVSDTRSPTRPPRAAFVAPQR